MKTAMKTILCAVLMALGTASCTKEYITKEEYITENHYDGAQIFTREYTINHDQWQEGNNGERPYLYAEIDNINITDNVINNGVVLGYILYTYNIEEELNSWNALPYLLTYRTNTGETIAENIRLEYEKGKIVFVIEDLDGTMPDPVGGPLIFKVAVIVTKNIK